MSRDRERKSSNMKSTSNSTDSSTDVGNKMNNLWCTFKRLINECHWEILAATAYGDFMQMGSLSLAACPSTSVTKKSQFYLSHSKIVNKNKKNMWRNNDK